MSGVPILVEGTALRALIVGGGTVASRKSAVLAHAGARVRVVAPRITPAMRTLADAGGITVFERRYERADIGDAQLVVAATDDRAVNAAVASDAHAEGRLVNVADRPGEGSFATMATHQEGALVIGVAAGGVPGAAARIRDALAMQFDGRYARALAELAAIRRLLLDRGEGAAWRARAGALFQGDFCGEVERGTLAERVASWR